MHNRRDEVQAHMFVVSRLSSGLLLADPDATDPPIRRTTRGLVIGLVLGLIAVIGVGIYGFLMPGGAKSWRTEGTMVTEKQTGARYLYTGGVLRPVANYTSALLIMGGRLGVRRVAATSLSGTPVGAPIGIEGAPDRPPAAKDLRNSAWQVCSSAGGDGTPVSTLEVAIPTVAPAMDRGLLVSAPGDVEYLIWHDRRFRLPDGPRTAELLGYATVHPYPVGAAFVNAIPAGADLAFPRVPGAGRTGPRLSGSSTRIGQVFVERRPGSADQYFLLTRDGLMPLTPTLVALGGGGKSADAIDTATASQHLTTAPGNDPSSGLPPTPPAVTDVPAGEQPCVRVDSTTTTVAFTADEEVGGFPVTARAQTTPPCSAIDRIGVPPGQGVLAYARSDGGHAATGATFLVTAERVKYPLDGGTALKNLGYDKAQAMPVPVSLLDLLPTGPRLDPVAAMSGTTTTTPPPTVGCRVEKPGSSPGQSG
ncbi:type VII secretion protein EccB [Actinoallomurus sp. NBC_01490]|uniref:type VII secretion protein EccB n=1 Tax=Actinoallomurus sp. NBC_01490 TaxID=2903557 RepID=UPI002E302137|nr:type VII secretion protein EccB [Actinoallomurus sp. NBC_01490]